MEELTHPDQKQVLMSTMYGHYVARRLLQIVAPEQRPLLERSFSLSLAALRNHRLRDKWTSVLAEERAAETSIAAPFPQSAGAAPMPGVMGAKPARSAREEEHSMVDPNTASLMTNFSANTNTAAAKRRGPRRARRSATTKRASSSNGGA